ncbi:MAG: glycosyltransferase family protein [Acidimicrobiales bacterium]
MVLLSGSPASSRFPRPTGLSVVQLPAVVKVGPEEYRPRDERLSTGLVRRIRSATILDVARRFEPDLVLVDHAPQGMRGELLPALEWLGSRRNAPRRVLGLRDVLDDAATVRRTWTEQGVYATLEHHYDDIVVYGMRDLYDVAEEYAIACPVAAKLRYSGYLGRTFPTTAQGSTEPYVLGCAGGGGDGRAVLEATLQAASRLGVSAAVVTGPLMDAADRAAVDELAAATPRARVCEFVADPGALVAGALAAVAMGGYNTLCELVSAGVPTVAVPRSWPRQEQAIRTRLFAGRGAVHGIAEPGPGMVEQLTTLVASAWEARRVPAGALDLGGLARVRQILLADAAECNPFERAVAVR